MDRVIKHKYWFVHGREDSIGNIFEDEKGNWIVVFNGVIEIGQPFLVRDMQGNSIDPDEIGLIQFMRAFVVSKTELER